MKTGRTSGSDRRKSPMQQDSDTEHWEQQVDYPAGQEQGRDNAEAADNSALSREERIRLIAYLLAESRGFDSGNEMDDWLAAEREVDGTGPEGPAETRR